MPIYEYEVKNKQGQVHRNTIIASNPWEAKKHLQQQGLHVIQLKERPTPTIFTSIRTTPKAMAIFFRHLYNTYRTGISLSEALLLFAETERSPLRQVAFHSAQRTGKGIMLSQALRETGYPFPVFVIPLIEVGERGGQLERIFLHLSEHFDREFQKEQNFKRHTIFAKAYGGCAILAMLLVMTIGSSFGAEIPLLSAFYGLLKMIAVLIAFWLLWRILSVNRWTAHYIDMFWLHLPVISAPWQKLMAARFARTLALLYATGIEASISLELAAQATGSPFIMKSAEKLSLQLQEGKNFSSVVKQIPFLPPVVQKMLVIGEKSGNIDESLNKAAEFLEDEAQTGFKVYPIVTGFVLYGFIMLVLVYLVFQGLGAIASFYRDLP